MPAEAIFRVFVSSTFGDMVDERRTLQREVFPRLQAHCRERGARFQAIDLRWGISAEAARDRRTMSICLAEVRRCRMVSPALNFVALLGSRYGWRPLPAAIPGADFDRLLTAASTRDRALLRRAYRRDKNAIPVCHQLVLVPEGPGAPAPGGGELAVREALDRALQAAFADEDEDARRLVYGASATHLEIAERLRLDPSDRASMRCYLREPRHERGIPAGDRAPLAALKAELVSRLDAGHVVHYRLDGEGHGLDSWSRRILADLVEAIEHGIQTAARRPRLDAHLSRAESLAAGAAGHRPLLARVRSYAAASDGRPLVITGAPGSGKSTLMARAWLRARAASSGAVVIGRFVGATPETASVEGLLRGLCAEIDLALGRDATLPVGEDALAKAFTICMDAASPERPLLLFIDGVEQLEGSGAPLAWVPARLSPNTRVVLSALEDDGPAGDALRELRARFPAEAFAELSPLPIGDAEKLLDRWLDAAGRCLQPRQRAIVRRAWARCPLPLFLRLAVEQARTWRSFDAVSDLAQDVPRMLHQVFTRLSDPAEHGLALVRATLGLLCVTRWGLAEDELLALLAADDVVERELAERSPHWPLEGFPFVVWARLQADLAPYLAARDAGGVDVHDFYHGAVRRSADQFAFAGREAQAVHAQLADYFGGKVASAPQPNRFAAAMPNRRKLSELPYHQTNARAWGPLVATLTDLTFLEAKCAAGLTGDLVGDYNRAAAAMPPQGEAFTPLAAWRAFVVRERAAFEANASIDGFVLQQARNQPARSEVARAWPRAPAALRGRRWLRLDAPREIPEAIVATLDRHAHGATDCAFDAGGDLLVSSGMDGAVLAWRTADWGLAEVVAELPGSADSVAVTGDGRLVATACADGLVRLTDRRARRTVVCEGRFDLAPRRCRFVDQDRRLLAVGGHGLKLFDTADGRLLALDLEDRIINDCTPAGGPLVTLGDCNGRVVVYDVDGGRVRQERRLDVRRVQGSALSADGHRLLAVGGTFQAEDDMQPFGERGVWNLADEGVISEERLTDPALSCLFLDEGRAYVVGLGKGTIRVHRSSDDRLLREVRAHDKGVRGLALAPSGRELVSAAFDGRLVVWSTAALVRRGKAPRSPGQGLFCAVSADGEAGWTATASVDHRVAEFAVEAMGSAPPAPPPVRGRHLADLPIKRRDPVMPMQVYEVGLAGIGRRAAHRGSPAAADGTYWLVHDGARMWPSTFHLLPALPAPRWSRENVTWARAPDGDQTVVVRATPARVDGAIRRRISLLWFAADAARKPEAVVELDLPLEHQLRSCHFSVDARLVRLAAGPAVVEVDRRGGLRRLESGDSAVSAFCDSPDGALLVVAHADGHLQLWDTAAGAALQRYEAHRGEVADVVFLDERSFASAGGDAMLRLWSTAGAIPEAVFVARAALAAVDAGGGGHRLLALDVHGAPCWLRVEAGAVKRGAELGSSSQTTVGSAATRVRARR